MRRYLRPRTEFVDTYSGFNCDSGLRTVNWCDSVDDEPGLDREAEAELRHVIHESLNPVVHYVTSPLWRIDTNLASFSMFTRSSSS